MPIDLCGRNRTIVSQMPFNVKEKVSEAVCVFQRDGAVCRFKGEWKALNHVKKAWRSWWQWRAWVH